MYPFAESLWKEIRNGATTPTCSRRTQRTDDTYRVIANVSRFDRLRIGRVDPRGCRASIHLLDPPAYTSCPGRRASLVYHCRKTLARLGGHRDDEPGSSGSHSAYRRSRGASAAFVLHSYKRIKRAGIAACPLWALCDHQAASCQRGGDLFPHCGGTITC